MKTAQPAPTTIDAYIAAFPPEVQAILEQIRETIRETVPDAQETISYGIPTFTLHGRYLVYFAGYKKHISLYPAPMGVAEFQEAVSVYGAGKGTMRFPLDQPMPFDLIRKIVRFRITENAERAAANRKENVRERMGMVFVDMAMSLDGFVAGPNNDDSGLHDR
jgi:uncharacterized protein YdhG (YjbR/CyaY superfamily)